MPPPPRTTYLDGLRGIAATIVTTNHFFMGGLLDHAFRSYWASPPSANRHLIQLPPIRLLFAAHAMVPLFFVISGYAISINLLHARNTHPHTLLKSLSSSLTRRGLRIYLPVILLATLSQLIYYLGLYHWPFADDIVWGRRPLTAPGFHLTYLLRYLLDIVNVVQFHHNPGLNGQLWTMPMEYRGSCVVYLVVSLCFLFGLHLLCLGDDGSLTPGYQFLGYVQSPRWDDEWAILSKSWKSLGAVLLVYAVDCSPVLQRPLNARLSQYLGRISFSLYLVHQSVYHVARDPVRNMIWWMLAGSEYPVSMEEARMAGMPFVLSWVGTAVVVGALVLYVAGLWTRWVDVRCVRAARGVERWLTGQ
ncbi:hypothetical protein BO70DRAFT_429609 [Aspergillus heteromorphus CBS 117.55]|uniref:Acyltransferase 3 domain-containing protein n=1 Tax=Aspergillus heteromorphus CBS 117.55 TaxID=1448321 RepID=A0A317W5I0_9EURO|nr:uncharacterized protein BO70DRAFT_429609 [Aspergillus heteromorphus CBS 117.55]PWY80582.1 hypothetical protein BO70DRAFT_429609 [Aspergillus heteromorphus CBS 117.55]